MNRRQRAAVTIVVMRRTIQLLLLSSLRTKTSISGYFSEGTVRFIDVSVTHKRAFRVSHQGNDRIQVILMCKQQIHPNCKWENDLYTSGLKGIREYPTSRDSCISEENESESCPESCKQTQQSQ
jgi:hypothetical protein